MDFCRKCGVELTSDNWYPSLVKVNNQTCKECHKRISAEYQRAHPEEVRERQRRWRERHPDQAQERLRFLEGRGEFAGDLEVEIVVCRKCGVRLTDENWYPSFRKRSVKRCSACQNKATAARDAANPGDATKRTARWRERNPEHAKDYYRANVEMHAERARKRLLKLKTEAIKKLGGKCIRCGITDVRVLQINHLNGDGRKDIHKPGQEMYAAIIAGARSIEDIDLRCANCNVIYEYEMGRRKLADGEGD